MAFFLGTTPVEDTARYVCAYLDNATGFSHALDLQTREPGAHERLTSLTLFHARSVPTIDLETYTLRILKYCPFQNEVLLGLIVYFQQMVDRCAQRRVPFTVDAYSIHRLIITGVTIGAKWFSDVFFTNSRYAKVGGLSVAELNNLELQFLSIIDFDLNIQPEVLQAVGSDLFAGRLPKLTNTPYPVDPVYNQQQHQLFAYQPVAAYAPPPQQPVTYYHDRQRQIPYQQQRTHKAMSYPGPNGAYYINPPAQMFKYNGSNIPANHQKHAYAAQNADSYDATDPSSGSTLASSPPPNAVHVTALNQGTA
ncbi:cyclin-like protein interacting with PHO85 [Coemansia sp. IMI 209127]|nr:cyclin-like protein interacting with PHO85 [Coemansia sp. IMI 209127]